jgi:hypothetical protein
VRERKPPDHDPAHVSTQQHRSRRKASSA